MRTGGGFDEFSGFQSVPAPQQPTQQPAQFADFGIFQSTPSTGMSQVTLSIIHSRVVSEVHHKMLLGVAYDYCELCH